MAQLAQPRPVKLLCGMIAARDDLLDQAAHVLADTFGPIDLVSQTWPFDLTDYYHAEMGSPLYRRLVSFRDLVPPDVLAQAKGRTNQIEADLARLHPAGPRRPVNLDVGYLELGKLVLASMKNFSHRVYLAQGVYAEVTLIYRRQGWERLPWTFPDFASGRYDAFLHSVRDRLRRQGRAEP